MIYEISKFVKLQYVVTKSDHVWICDLYFRLTGPVETQVLLWHQVYHKQEVGFLLFLLVQIVTWQYNPNPLIKIGRVLL